MLLTRKFTDLMIPGIAKGHHVVGSITGDLVLRCQRISIIPKLQHPCAHLWPSPLNNSSISSGLTALSSGDSWPESQTIIPWAETEHFKFLPLVSVKTRKSNVWQIFPNAKIKIVFIGTRDVNYFDILLHRGLFSAKIGHDGFSIIMFIFVDSKIHQKIFT